MEALSPTARIVPLRAGAASELEAIALRAALGLGADEARARAIGAQAGAIVASLTEGAAVVAPLHTPWGAVLDVVASSHTRPGGLDARAAGEAGAAGAGNVPRGDDWAGEAVVPANVLGASAPALWVRAVRFGFGSPEQRAAWPAVDVAGFVRPYPGLEVSGDAATVLATQRGIRAVVVDALGHGDGAAKSAAGLVRHLTGCGSLRGDEAIASAHVHRAAHPRGAAAVLLDLEGEEEGWYVGVGNIDAVPLGPATRPVSRSGTVGLALPRLSRERVRLPPGSGLAIVTDGLILRWPSFTPTGVAGLAAPLVLGVVLATAERRTDDATVLVVRRPR